MEDQLYGRVLCIYTPQYFVLSIGSIEQIRLNESLMNVIDEICQKFSTHNNCVENHYPEGSIVFAYNYLFKKWGRAFVISLKNCILKCNIRLTVYFFDFGYCANICLKDIIPITYAMEGLTSDLSVKILTGPVHIVPVALANIKSLADYWSHDAVEKFSQIVNNTVFKVFLIECSSYGPAKVSLVPTTLSPNSLENESICSNQDNKQTSVSQLLIDLNLAKEDMGKGVSDIINCNQDAGTDSYISQHLAKYKPIPIDHEKDQTQVALTDPQNLVDVKIEFDQLVEKVVIDQKLLSLDKIEALEMPEPQLVKKTGSFSGKKTGKIIRYDRETMMGLRGIGASHLDWHIINELDEFALNNPMIGPVFIRSPKAKAARLKALEKCINPTPVKSKAKPLEKRAIKYAAAELKAFRHVTSPSQDSVSVRVRQNLAKFSLQNMACIKVANKLNPNANNNQKTNQILQRDLEDQEILSRSKKRVKADRSHHRTTSMQLPATNESASSNQCMAGRKSFSSGMGNSNDIKLNKIPASNANYKKKDLNPKCMVEGTKKENGLGPRHDKVTPVKRSQKENNKGKSGKISQALAKSSENLLTLVGCDRDQTMGVQDSKSRSESKKPVVNTVGGTGWNFLKSFSRLLGNSDAATEPNILSSSSSSSSLHPPPPSSQTSTSVKKSKTRNRVKNSMVVRARSSTPPAKTKAVSKDNIGQKTAKIPNKQPLNNIKPINETTAQTPGKSLTYTKLEFDELSLSPLLYTPMKRVDLTGINKEDVPQTTNSKKRDRNKYRHLVGVDKNVKHLHENTIPAVKLNISPLKEILLPSTSTAGHKTRESARKTTPHTMKKIDMADIFRTPIKSVANTTSTIGHEYRPYNLWHYGNQSSSSTTRQQYIPMTNILPSSFTQPIFMDRPRAPTRPVPIFATYQAHAPTLKPILGFRTPNVRHPPTILHNPNNVFRSRPNGYISGPTEAPEHRRHRHDSETLIQNDAIQSSGFYSPPLLKRRTPGAPPGPPQPGSGAYFLTYRGREAQTQRGTMYPTYDYEDTFREMYR